MSEVKEVFDKAIEISNRYTKADYRMISIAVEEIEELMTTLASKNIYFIANPTVYSSLHKFCLVVLASPLPLESNATPSDSLSYLLTLLLNGPNPSSLSPGLFSQLINVLRVHSSEAILPSLRNPIVKQKLEELARKGVPLVADTINLIWK